jgi:sulfatase maturation enzyme AslB (radical SAM superfamily)
MDKNYYENVATTKEKLDKISPTMCMAKWLQVSMHLPQGLTQSCYHPPTHLVPLEELDYNYKALHNTKEKVRQRKLMSEGQRPEGCQYCWNIEDAPDGPHYSDRHYRSSEWWVEDAWNEVITEGFDNNINPRYVEVNFNQACNFKCVYCSPHLSSSWQSEVMEHGPFFLENYIHNDIDHLRKANLMPIESTSENNPYVQAFWNWWPELYKDIKVFRMTGGEPLMDKNTYKVLDYINSHPNSFLDLSITSNLCPPDQKLFEKFIEKLHYIEKIRVWEDKTRINPETNNNWYVAPAVKHFSLFVSLDSVGQQAEYIRHGLDYNRLIDNIHIFLQQTQGTEISFINTFNLLSIPKLKEFLKLILELRKKFGRENQHEIKITPPDNNGFKHPDFVRKPFQRIWFDIPYLRKPDWFSCQIAVFYPELMDILYDCLKFMEDNVEDENYYKTFTGFKKYEIAKLKRDIAWINNGKKEISEEKLKLHKKHFWQYIQQIDYRRKLNFIKLFPELTNWYNDCFAESIA